MLQPDQHRHNLINLTFSGQEVTGIEAKTLQPGLDLPLRLD